MAKTQISFIFIFIFGLYFSQWKPLPKHQERLKITAKQENQLFSLDISLLKEQLKNSKKTGKNTQAIEILLPTINGNIERFAVYSSPVVVETLAEKFGLGSYVGRGIDDPSKYLRFSVSGNQFQSMIIKDNDYQFIEPIDEPKSIYKISPKTNKNETPFTCSTNESEHAKKQLERLVSSNQLFTYTNRSSDRKFRTLRLALSVTGEYTQYFGGVQPAMEQINATLTRVNGIFEKDLALRLILQDFPQLIYTNPATDPYSDASTGADGTWSTELQNNLTATIGNAAYDIGHLFGASGGGGDAGCIGCICEDNTQNNQKNKGSGFTSPGNNIPRGDTFDIDFVIHEIGHQLGANHTFSHQLESYNSNVEPGSGSTIMGYAGITNADVQQHSDAYFHSWSISQIQDVLLAKSCDVETPIANYPPVINPLQDYTIPKGTAFVLSATATDPENNNLSYTWEQVDNASSRITRTTGNNTTGALFRSLPPSSVSERYFPKLASVLAGRLTVSSDWESVPYTSREMNFRITVRDNSPIAEEQQTNYLTQKITVGENGPFKINLAAGDNLFSNIENTLSWDVANTNNAPYNVAEVAVSYTINNGETWTELSAATPNNGSLKFVLPANLQGQQNLQFRVTALGNVFYAISPKVNVIELNTCIATVPENLSVSQITYNTAEVSWDSVARTQGYLLQYKKQGETLSTDISTSASNLLLNNLEAGTMYEFRVKSICPNSESEFSNWLSFSTLNIQNCTSSSENGTNQYIQKVEIEQFANASEASEYSDFTQNKTLFFYLNKNTKQHSIRVTPKWSNETQPVSIVAWIDFDNNQVFSDSEQILAVAGTTERTLISEFKIPENAVTNANGVKMRVSLKTGNNLPEACEHFAFGEVEDYTIIFQNTDLYYGENTIAYPNPFLDIINTTNVENGTTYELYDMSGRLIRNGKVFLNKINFSGLIPATYILAIEGKESIKIIKD